MTDRKRSPDSNREQRGHELVAETNDAERRQEPAREPRFEDEEE